jgi:cholesterol oxidase
MQGGGDREEFQVVVVGSGFGGSVMAYRLAKAGLDVCLLERGKAWPPRSFPRTPYEFSRAFWDPSEGLYGLFDLWYFGRLAALVSSGLGGGSLIYANVILEKPAEWFDAWPITPEELEPRYAAVREMLDPVLYPYPDTPKTAAFLEAAENEGLDVSLPPLAVTFSGPDGEPGTLFDDGAANLHGKPRYTCRLVGECNTGCNFGSKNSLDFTYLSKGKLDHGLEIRCRNEVKGFEPLNGGYRIRVADHSCAEEGKPRAGPPALYELFAQRLILCAGALGTPYLLLRNRVAFPNISRQLGTRFNGNGDFIAFAARTARPLDPSRGPVITASVKVPDDGDGRGGHLVQDGGYPDFLAWVGEMLAFRRLAWAGKGVVARLAWESLLDNPDSNLSAEAAGLVGAPRLAGGTLPLLGMGREPPQGRMKLSRRGLLDVEWSPNKARPYFDYVEETLQEVTDGLGATFENSLLWTLNKSITVHPLGGCPMGKTDREGVVDPRDGHVHNYERLHVADGSVMPGPVGANPSFTIAAVADHFADAILAEGTPDA